jgi:NAD(P)-dependent dehydrogenase (short-subunit alcohol dehydrogenase family)
MQGPLGEDSAIREKSAMKGKVALVTGSGQGIGRGIAQAFAKAGAKVVLAELDEEAGYKAEKQISRSGTVMFLPCDVVGEESVRQCVEGAVRRFKRLDFVINNAGIGIGKPVEDLDLLEWNRVLGTNLTSIFLFAKHAAKHLRKARGAIVNIASTRAFMSEPDTEAYSASKGGVVSLTHALAISLGPAIRVNCISPGWIDVTGWKKSPGKSDVRPVDREFHPAGRVGRPEDIAAMALFLCSPQSEFITGINVTIDGGVTKKMIYP